MDPVKDIYENFSSTIKRYHQPLASILLINHQCIVCGQTQAAHHHSGRRKAIVSIGLAG